jgi:hypothetical protein
VRSKSVSRGSNSNSVSQEKKSVMSVMSESNRVGMRPLRSTMASFVIRASSKATDMASSSPTQVLIDLLVCSDLRMAVDWC